MVDSKLPLSMETAVVCICCLERCGKPLRKYLSDPIVLKRSCEMLLVYNIFSVASSGWCVCYFIRRDNDIKTDCSICFDRA